MTTIENNGRRISYNLVILPFLFSYISDHIFPPPTNTTMPPSNHTRPKLPYKSHPLYSLRHKTIWTTAIGLLLTILACSDGYSPHGSFVVLLFLFPASFLFVVYDLMTWGIEKATLIILGGGGRTHTVNHSEDGGEGEEDDGDDDKPKDPHWPRKVLIVFDAIFALTYQWLFWGAISSINHYFYNYDNKVLKSYAALSGFVMSLLHGKAFWREVMARLKEKWVKTLERRPCKRCGFDGPIFFVEGKGKEDEETRSEGVSRVFSFGAPRSEGFGIPGWAKTFNERRVRGSRGRRQRDDVEAGPSNEDDESESLVIAPTPEGSSSQPTLKGYGTLSQSVKSLNSEVESVVKKKGAKRIVGEEWMDGLNGGKGKAKEKAVGDGEDGP
jgi:hypothetical protein